MIVHPRGRRRAHDVAAVAVVVALAAAIKLSVAQADADRLRWILAPTARLVEWLTGARFAFEPHLGYLSRARLYAIVPACAGTNFMVVLFGSLACGGLPVVRTWRARLAWFACSAAIAPVTTVPVNALRIALAIQLHGAGLSFGPVTPERLHLVLGVALFVPAACATHAVVVPRLARCRALAR